MIHGKGSQGQLAAGLAEQDGWTVKFTDSEEGTSPERHQVCHIAIGDNRVRAKFANHELMTLRWRPSYQHPTVKLGAGCYIGQNVVVNLGVVVGKAVILNTGCIIEHDCIVGDFAHIAPNAVLCGGVLVGEGAFIGAGAVVKPGVQIGAWTTVGCGAVVIKDVPEGETYAGNPARKLRG